MILFKKNTQIDFMRQRRVAMMLSVGVLLLCVGSIIVQRLHLGIDFTGGTQVEAGYDQDVALSPIRRALEVAGFQDYAVQHFGTSKDVLIRFTPDVDENKADLSQRILEVLQDTGQVELRRVDFVGPRVGEELTEQGGLAVLAALFLILLYVTLRFEFYFAVGAVIALIHDVLLVVGVFSLWQLDFDLAVLAAILAVIGYSLNDSIVTFDRIRDNFRKMRKANAIEVVNASINQVLSRTLITSLTTLLVLFALLILGGEVIRGFTLALIVGVVVGTYSSIYVASAAALALGASRQAFIQPPKEHYVDDRP